VEADTRAELEAPAKAAKAKILVDAEAKVLSRIFFDKSVDRLRKLELLQEVKRKLYLPKWRLKLKV
jgi:hypothetical protein